MIHCEDATSVNWTRSLDDGCVGGVVRVWSYFDAAYNFNVAISNGGAFVGVVEIVQHCVGTQRSHGGSVRGQINYRRWGLLQRFGGPNFH